MIRGTAIQTDLENWGQKNCMKGKCKVLQPEVKDSVHKYMLMDTQLENISSGQDFVMPADKLNIEQPMAKNPVISWAALGEVLPAGLRR